MFVCLPKSWAMKNGVSRGSLLAISETEDGKILIDPRYDVEPSLRTAAVIPGPYLSREIIAKYLLGVDVIRVESKGIITNETREIVKNAVGRLIGLEIVEEDRSSIVLQCLLELSALPPEKILRRAYSITAGMHRDVINALVDGDIETAKSVMARDDESNRQYFLIVRILRTIVQTPALHGKLGVTPIECLDYRLVGSLVESIGDECVRMASKTMELKGKKLTEDLRRLFIDLHASCFEAHENAVSAFFSGDMALAEKVRTIHEKTEKAYSHLEKLARAQSFEIIPQILAVASFMRQIYEHSVDIADLVVPKKE